MVNTNNSTSSQFPEVFVLKRSSNVLYDNKRFADAALSISQSNEIDLRARLPSMPVDAYIDCIPQSLLLLDTLYSKFILFVDIDRPRSGPTDQITQSLVDHFPVGILKPDRLIRQLIWFLTRELDPGAQSKKKSSASDWKMIGPRIKNLLKVIEELTPSIKRQLRLEKSEIEKALEGLGLHGLINFGDHRLIEIGEAVKQEMCTHYQRIKALHQQLEKLLHKLGQSHSDGHYGSNGAMMGGSGGGGGTGSASLIGGGGKDASITYSINDPKGPIPSRSSHQRLMNLKLSEIRTRLQTNECMIQLVQACLRNPDLQSLERILQKRIRYDRDILSQFAFLTRRNGTYALASEDPVISHVLVLFSKGYERVLKLMPRSLSANPSCTDDSGLGGDEDEAESNRRRSSLIASGRGGGEEANPIPTRPSPVKSPRFHRSNTSTNPIDHFPNRPILNRDQSLHHGPPRLSIFRSSNESLHYITNNNPSEPTKIYSSMPSLSHHHQTDRWIDRSACVNGYTRGSVTNLGNAEKTEVERRLRSEIDRLHSALENAHDRILKQQHQLNSQRVLNPVTKLHQSNLPNGNPQLNRSNYQQQPQSIDLIERFGTLYSIDRAETLLELDRLPELHDAEDLQTKILLSVVVLSFRFVWQDIHKAKEDVWKALRENRSIRDVERESNSHGAMLLQHVGEYVLEKARSDNYAKTAWKVSTQLYQTLYEFASLKTCARLDRFILDCTKLAWHLSMARSFATSNQTTHSSSTYTIEFDETEFDPERHMRLQHSSDLQSRRIKRFVWPALIDASSRKCVYRAVVIT